MFTKKKEDVKDKKLKEEDISSISLKINNYNDIFSSFDPRPYSEKALSDDFLQEAGRASRDKVSGQMALYLLMPKEKRNAGDEVVIKRRMREHFKRHYLRLVEEVKKVKTKGIFMTLLGVLFITIAVYFSDYYGRAFIIDFLLILLEPAGWFTAWTGLDQIFYTVPEKREELEFNERMSNAEIVFMSE